MAAGHLMGVLVSNGHQTHTINFKRQETRSPEEEANDPSYEPGQYPLRSYGIQGQQIALNNIAGWKKITPLEIKNIVTRLNELKPDAIGITCLTHGISLAGELSEHLRQHFDLPILFGGVGTITEPELAIKYADLICTGEGEDVIVEIAKRLDAKQDLTGIVGTHCRLPNGEIQKNPKSKLPVLSEIPLPVYDAEYYTFINGFRFERNVPHNHRQIDTSYPMMTQRGCPFSCTFCIESMLQREFGKKEHLRRTSVERALDELHYAKKLGFTYIAFWDDVFLINPEWLDEFLPRYKAEIGLPFFCYTYPSTTKKHLLEKVRDAGCVSIGMGIQSGSTRILEQVYDRKVKRQQVIEACNLLVESGIPTPSVDFIPRTAFDTEQDLEDTIDLLLDIPAQLAPSFYNELTIYPNYPIHERLNRPEIISATQNLSEDTYAYYFKLMAITRHPKVDRELLKQIRQDPYYREDHNRLNEFLPKDEENPAVFNQATSTPENEPTTLKQEMLA